MENLPPTRHRTLQSQITTPDKRWGVSGGSNPLICGIPDA